MGKMIIFMRKTLLWVSLVVGIMALQSCMTSNSQLVQNRAAEQNQTFQRQLEERQRNSQFQATVQSSFSYVVQHLSTEMYKQLRGTGALRTNFATDAQNINYYYGSGTAEFHLVVVIERKGTNLVIEGTLRYLNDRTIRYTCTNKQNTKWADEKYIKELVKGVEYK